MPISHVGEGVLKQRALILQGGGSLGAYAAGACDRLCSSVIEDDGKNKAKDGHVFDVLIGTSSGAINAVILVSYVVAKLKEKFASGKEPIDDFYFSGDMPSVMGAVRAMPEFSIAEIALATLIAMVTIITSLTTTHRLIRNMYGC